ncbi:LOW QUALITY PROTEIN: hypothetical protein QYF61_014596 [Mycteria americana]|uniref:Uncharacterized protein n=1 Tax=Mycteria americana TaxID=33587 RepID=A0AAN7MUE6_MYCAM|nr:LOW QUALITY PROTEIN: hypothetical protein QYF61_014596 [Mycteria americana]
MGYGPGEKMSPGQLFDFQGSPPSGSGMVHPEMQKSNKGSRRPAWMTRELLTKLRYEQEVYDKWKQGQVTQEEYRDTVQSCRDEIMKAKAHLELNLVRNVKGNKKSFYSTLEDIEKPEVLNAFFVSIFTGKTSLQESQALETSGKVWSKEDLPWVEQDQIREHLNKLDIHKSMG